jgi:hypothetical protein
MSSIAKNIARALSYGSIVAILALPANAAGVGVGASVGGGGGVNAGAGASTGGSGGVNGGLGAPVGGSGGANAGAGASLGGSDGVTAGVGANVGDGTNANVDAAVGNDATPGTPGTLGTLGTPGAKPPAGLAQMSGTQLARMKKRCVDVLSSEGTYDSDLKALCLMIARR